MQGKNIFSNYKCDILTDIENVYEGMKILLALNEDMNEDIIGFKNVPQDRKKTFMVL